MKGPKRPRHLQQIGSKIGRTLRGLADRSAPCTETISMIWTASHGALPGESCRLAEVSGYPMLLASPSNGLAFNLSSKKLDRTGPSKRPPRGDGEGVSASVDSACRWSTPWRP